MGMSMLAVASIIIASPSTLVSFSPALFIFLNNQQIIKTVVLMGEISNSYLIKFWQSALNIDLDIIPSDKFPKVKLSNSFFLKGEPSEEIYQNSGYPSKSLVSLVIAKLLELIGTLFLFLIVYTIMDIMYIHVT